MEIKILYFKIETIKYCFDKMTEIYDNNLLPKIRPATITGKDIGEGGWQIACYGEFFFFEVSSFFDCLARYFTINENKHKKNIYFHNWIEYQIKYKRKDNFIMHLNKHFEGWYKYFKEIRNPVAHFSHIYAEIKSIMLLENRNMQFLTMDIDGKNIELMTYCNDIHKEINNLLDYIDENKYWNNQYEYLSVT